MTGSANSNAFRSSSPADVQVVTSDGQSVAARSAVLAAASPVLERMIDRARRGWSAECTIGILGVPSDAVLAFLHFLYSSSEAMGTAEGEEAMEAHGVRLLALAHAYRVGWLKRGAEAAVAARLTAERAVDMLKLAKLCDAPRLYLRCARLAAKDLAAVEQSEGWRFARRHDAGLELEVLQLLEEADQRKKRWKRERACQEVYGQLSEAMVCLEHIFTEGCTGTSMQPPSCEEQSAPCVRFRTCQGLHQLMRHFATCGKKLSPGGCPHCKRMFQLFRLHSSICDRSDESCKVPLCNDRFVILDCSVLKNPSENCISEQTQCWKKIIRDNEKLAGKMPFFENESVLFVLRCAFQQSWLYFYDNDANIKMQTEEKVDKTWKLLVKKVIRARVMSSLANRKRPEIVTKSWAKYSRGAKLS